MTEDLNHSRLYFNCILIILKRRVNVLQTPKSVVNVCRMIIII